MFILPVVAMGVGGSYYTACCVVGVGGGVASWVGGGY